MPTTGSTVGWDGSAAARQAAGWAAVRAARFGGALHLVRVLEPAASGADLGAAVRRIRRALDEESALLVDRYPGLHVEAAIRVADRRS
ncbi:MAG: hypothetical protein QOE37_127 [Microbacteriaceae bacterium]|nr:hypothetical protein [Microbacteriaceae bacterium]